MAPGEVALRGFLRAAGPGEAPVVVDCSQRVRAARICTELCTFAAFFAEDVVSREGREHARLG